jgi:hypothetical protein
MSTNESSVVATDYQTQIDDLRKRLETLEKKFTERLSFDEKILASSSGSGFRSGSGSGPGSNSGSGCGSGSGSHTSHSPPAPPPSESSFIFPFLFLCYLGPHTLFSFFGFTHAPGNCSPEPRSNSPNPTFADEFQVNESQLVFKNIFDPKIIKPVHMKFNHTRDPELDAPLMHNLRINFERVKSHRGTPEQRFMNVRWLVNSYNDCLRNKIDVSSLIFVYELF